MSSSDDYARLLASFYDEWAERLAALSRETDVVVLCEGDPFFYGSFMHLYTRLQGRAKVEVIAGIPGMAGCWNVAGLPIALGDDVMTVLTGTLPEAELAQRVQNSDALVIMKTGRNLAKIRRVLEAAGRLDEAWLIERGTMPDEKVARLARCRRDGLPVFRDRAGAWSARSTARGGGMSGSLTIAGLGPGDAALVTPEVSAALAEATDVLGYAPYVARVPARDGLRLHPSDNRMELQRAGEALKLAAEGRSVVIVSSGDPGVFAMAAAVFEALEAAPELQDLSIRVLPGVTAMLAAAARAGAPLGHDFCAINLSDNLKPWPVIEKRLRLAAEADFAIAIYNPRSASRPEGFAKALDVLREAGCGDRTVIFAHAVTTPKERIETMSLAEARPEMADMATLVIVGNSATRKVGRWVYAPRRAS